LAGRWWRFVVAVTVSAACAGDAETAARVGEVPGIVFDPGRTQVNDTVGGIVVEAITAERNVVDSTLVASAHFRGEVRLSGSTIPHFDADLRGSTVCFEADSASAMRLPRWQHDTRRPWFCFTNHTDAVEQLAQPGTEHAADIVIDDFVIHRGLSDQVNSARLIRVLNGRPPS
jgi:hypothetical protein